MAPGLRVVLSNNTLAVMQTYAIGDINGAQKNAFTARGWCRYRRSPRSMVQVLISDTLLTPHRLDAPCWGAPTVRAVEPLLKKKLTATARWSLLFDEIASTEAGAPWHSPHASNYSAPVADVQLVHDARALGQIRLASMAWLSAVLDARHRADVKFRVRDDQPWAWCVPLSRYDDSCVLA